MHGLLLKSSKDEAVYGSVDIVPPPYQSMGNSHWETLEFYLVSTLFHFALVKHSMLIICVRNTSQSCNVLMLT